MRNLFFSIGFFLNLTLASWAAQVETSIIVQQDDMKVTAELRSKDLIAEGFLHLLPLLGAGS